MNTLNDIFSCFFKVRKIIALSVTGVFCLLSIKGDIKTSEFIPIFSMIIGYYFGKSTALDSPPNTSKNQNTKDNQDSPIENTMEEK